MGKLAAKIREALEAAFDGVDVRLTPNTSLRKISGLIVWAGFESDTQMDRQDKLWKVIEAAVGAEERTHLGTFLTVTPQELQWSQEAIAA